MSLGGTEQILGELRTLLRKRAAALHRLQIQQLATIQLAVRPTPRERLFNCAIRLAHVFGQGCCYMSKPVPFEQGLIGQTVAESAQHDLATQIAVLDGAY